MRAISRTNLISGVRHPTCNNSVQLLFNNFVTNSECEGEYCLYSLHVK